MELNRRHFVERVFAAAAAAVVLPTDALASRLLPRRYTEALRSRLYPGPLKRLRHEEVRKQGKWAG